MPLPDGVLGPHRLEEDRIEELNRVFSDAFTERYHRDGMTGVRVPRLNPAIWRYAIGVAGAGALYWTDANGGIAAFNLAHVSGTEGWMGPLAVRPDCQGRGLGRTIVAAGVRYLEEAGCATIGLETMPRTVDNIGFYSRLGFRPQHLTVSMVRDGVPSDAARTRRVSALGPGADWLARAAALTDRLVPGLDFSTELRLTRELSLGDVSFVAAGKEWRAFALWQDKPLAAGRPAEEVRLLKVVAADRASFRQVIEGAMVAAGEAGLGRVGVRCQTAYGDAYGDLLAAGFRVHWTDLRMAQAARPERRPDQGVVFSNWEI